MKLYQVEVGNIRAGLEVQNDVVTAATSLKNSIGLRINRVKAWAERKGGTVTLIGQGIAPRGKEEPWLTREPK
jgi:hypothetical protein